MPKKKPWIMYVVRCSDGSLYAGITTDLKRRVYEHNSTKKGARYTRSRRPVHVAYSHRCRDRSEAMVSENGFKRMSKQEKEEFIEEFGNGKLHPMLSLVVLPSEGQGDI